MGQLKKFISVVSVAVLCIGIVTSSSTVVDVDILEGNDSESMNITLALGSSTTLPIHSNDDDKDSIVDPVDSSEISMLWGFFDFIWISMLIANPDNPFAYFFMALVLISHLLMLDGMLFGFTLRGLIKCGLLNGDPNKTYDSIADFYGSDDDF